MRRTLRSQAMAPIWPFNRKKTGAPEAKPAEEKKVVSYESDVHTRSFSFN